MALDIHLIMISDGLCITKRNICRARHASCPWMNFGARVAQPFNQEERLFRENVRWVPGESHKFNQGGQVLIFRIY